MSTHAFLLAADRILQVANPCGAGLQYHAQSRVLLPQAQVPAQSHETAETIIVVLSGTLEVMIGGAVGALSAGDFVRVPPMAVFAYRNPSDIPANILVRVSPVRPPRNACRVSLTIAVA